MKPRFTEEEYKAAKFEDRLGLICYNCDKDFTMKKGHIYEAMKKDSNSAAKFCSRTCVGLAKRNGRHFNCENCNKDIIKTPSQMKKTKHVFCSQSCSATYHNAHKTTGIRRSKFEFWLEQRLNQLYPTLDMDFNKKDAINSELDIYIPTMKLAFELNGIFHYEPIHGEAKLIQIQNNDPRKLQTCIDNNVELCIINTKEFKHFKESIAINYLKLVTDIIDTKII